MGAEMFEQNAKGSTLVEAYNRAVQDAFYESGHDSYNGTISTTSDVVDVSACFPKGTTEKTKENLCHRSLLVDPDPKMWDAKTKKYVSAPENKTRALKGLSPAHRKIVKELASKGVEKWEAAGGFKCKTGQWWYLYGWAAS